MTEKVLFVDDERKVLSAISRQFGDSIEFETAAGGEEALTMLDEGPFAVVVADMRMPGMSGVELLSKWRERSPDTVRMMLTGYADVNQTIEAVNQGNVFRFLSKPCPQEVFETAIQDALAQYRLVTAERELLDGTLQGSINLLSETLSVESPLIFGRTCQIQRIAMAMADVLDISDDWDLRIATRLFPLGYVAVSDRAQVSIMTGQPISDSERQSSEQHAMAAKRLLDEIPRFQKVAEIVAYQDKHFDGSGLPHDGVEGESIPLGARILKLANNFDVALRATGSATSALGVLCTFEGHYDPHVFRALEIAVRAGLCDTPHDVICIASLADGMVLAADLMGIDGQIRLARGQSVSEMIKCKLLSLLKTGAIEDACSVECPVVSPAVQKRAAEVVEVNNELSSVADEQVQRENEVATPVSADLADPPTTVLLVDDDAKLLRGLRRGLADEDFHVLTAVSAAEAQAVISKNEINVIICDNLMSGTLGTDFLASIRKDYPNIVLMMLSGYMPPSAASRMVQEIGISRVLNKPCSATDVATAIREALSPLASPV